jgi:hypothetical protein
MEEVTEEVVAGEELEVEVAEYVIELEVDSSLTATI